MNRISAKIICDSINPWGNRITTFELVFPRFILPELATHRMFSKNSASSRAIPFKKMIKSIQDEPFIPIAFQKDHSGMQGNEYLKDDQIQFATDSWLQYRDNAIQNASILHSNNVTKQLCNRLVEPFMYIKVLLTATEFDNFFELRCPKYVVPIAASANMRFKSWKDVLKHIQQVTNDYRPEAIETFENFTTVQRLKQNQGAAEIHLMDLAEKMWDAYNESKPKSLGEGQWHIPYLNEISQQIHPSEIYNIATVRNDGDGFTQPQLVNASNQIVREVSTMMCARTSYTTIDTDDSVWSIEKYLKKYGEMWDNRHWSPFEHCSQVPTEDAYYSNVKGKVKYQKHYGETKEMNLIGVTLNSFQDINDELFGWFDNYHGFQSLRHQLEHELRS